MSGITGMSSLMRTLKLSAHEDQKIAQEESNSFYDQKITEMRTQVKILKSEARKMGQHGITNFCLSIASAGLQLATGVVGSAVTKLQQFASLGLKIASKTLAVATGLLEGSQKLVDGFQRKTLKNMEAQSKTHEIRAETMGKMSDDAKTNANDAKLRGNDAIQTLRQATRDLIESDEVMAKIK